MTRGKTCPLVRAIGAMLPDAKLNAHTDRAWHSATFAGSRITMRWHIPAGFDPGSLVQFRKTLPDHIFTLSRGFVADIAIAGESDNAAGGIDLEIEALILDD